MTEEPEGANQALPAFGICGWSGSGKSTLVERLVGRFTSLGFKVAVIKDDAHGPDLDQTGKDSDRFFRAGADVVLTGPDESFLRTHLAGCCRLGDLVMRLDSEYDLILVEGHKSASFSRKVWLLKNEAEACPNDAPGVQRVLAPGEDRIGIVAAMVADWLRQRVQATPLAAGILIGGASRRMGRPKQLLRLGNTTWLEHIVASVQPAVRHVVLLGAGRVPPSLLALPMLPDAPDKRGPLAGMVAAMRWRPEVSWVFVACDLPRISSGAVDWLLSQRAPGAWAILPRLHGSQAVEPLFALYEFRARRILESSDAPSDLARQPNVATPEPPVDIASAWANMNTPMDVAEPQ
jgi:molybdopterin-guanine dinucleotide biosynthesis protein MobB